MAFQCLLFEFHTYNAAFNSALRNLENCSLIRLQYAAAPGRQEGTVEWPDPSKMSFAAQYHDRRLEKTNG